MNAIQKFTNTICDQDVTVSTMMVGDTPWFCAKDVGAALGYANPRQAILHNVDEQDRAQLKDLMGLPHSPIPEYHEGAQVFISESGLYSLIMTSQKPTAKAFQRWVTRDILPSIRKTGQYTMNAATEVTKKREELEVVEIEERIQSANERIESAKRRCIEEDNSSKRRCIEEDKSSKRRCIEEGMLSLQRLGLPIDDRDKMRAKDCINEITFGQLQNASNDNEICIRSFLSERGICNATMDAKLGKAAKQLYVKENPDYTFQKKQIYVNGQMIPANVWRESMRPYLERALAGIMAT